MGDAWVLGLSCANCGRKMYEILYAPSHGHTRFTCEWCGVENQILEVFTTEVANGKAKKED